MRIAVIAGGRTPERDVSLRGGRRVLGALETLGHDATLLDPADVKLVESLDAYGPTLCWLALHGKEGEDGTVQRLLDLLGHPVIRGPPRSTASSRSTKCSRRMCSGGPAYRRPIGS